MRTITLFIIFNLFALVANAQVPSSCTPTAMLTHSYAADAKDLALKRMFAVHSPDTARIIIPAIHSDSILTGLAAIQNVGPLLQADSVFNEYCIHDFPFGMQRSISVKVDTSYHWTTGWKHLSATTGYGALDSFMLRYGFSIQHYDSSSFSWMLRDIAYISTLQPINIRAFNDSLRLFSGIIFTDVSTGTIGDPNYITYERDSVAVFTFRLGWGDCPAGCTSSKIWKYKVDDLCNVTLLSVVEMVNDPFPTPLHCDLARVQTSPESMKPGITISPNPATNILTIQNIAPNTTYHIYTMMGSDVQSGPLKHSSNTISLKDLPAGIYLLQLITDAGTRTVHRIIKE